MSVELATPFLAALCAALGARLLQRRLPPVVGAWLLSGLAIVAALMVFAAEFLTAFTFVASRGWFAERLVWCRSLAESQHVPSTLVGVAATVALGVGVVRVIRMFGSQIQVMRSVSSAPVVVIHSSQPDAFAVPGRPGHVHVTTAMLDALDEDGRRVLFAHERAHLDGRHHRFIFVGSLVTAFFPPLRPLARQIAFSTERWADEVAAEQVGDRTVTARSIAAAAFASSGRTDAPFSLALADLGVVGRVEALLARPCSRRSLVVLAGMSLLVLNVAGGAAQAQHLVDLVRHICDA